MGEVFISYAHGARRLTEEVAAEIEAAGHSVWWDQALDAGDSFRHTIRQAIASAKAVVVIWSRPALGSAFVAAEAALAARSGKLVSVLGDGVAPADLPLPFSEFHQTELIDFDLVLRAIEARLGGELAPATAHEAFSDQRWHGFWLLDPKQESFDATDAGPSPASLLLARHALVPFVDLHGLRTRMIDWAAGSGGGNAQRPIAGRLLHAPGGVGKTRLAIETCAALADQGWLAGFVPDKSQRDRYLKAEEKLARLVTDGRGARPLLLVVDYAESRQDDLRWLAQCLVARRKGGGAPARLLALSRGAGEWWNALYDDTDIQKVFGLDAAAPAQKGDIAAVPEELPPDARLALLDSSVEAFASVLTRAGRTLPTTPPSGDQRARIVAEDGDYGRPLAVQMEALLHIYGAAQGRDRVPIDVLLDRILRLEREHWSKSLGFAPDLARSFWTLSEYALGPLGRHAEAATAAREGLELIAPHLERHPAAHGDVARGLAQVYREQAEKAGTAPDAALLARIEAALPRT